MKTLFNKQIGDDNYILEEKEESFRIGRKRKGSDTYRYSNWKNNGVLAVILNRLIESIYG